MILLQKHENIHERLWNDDKNINKNRSESIFILTKGMKIFPNHFKGGSLISEKRKYIPHKYPGKVVVLIKNLLSIAKQKSKKA